MRLYGAVAGEQTTSRLYEIDPVDGSTTDLGDIGRATTALAFDPTTGILYGVSSPNSAVEPQSLFTIDPASGAATLVGPVLVGATPVAVADIAFDDTGQMWGFLPQSSQRKLATINKTTGAATPLGTSGFTSSHCGYAMDFDQAGVLYCFANGPHGNLYTFNLGTGAATSTGALDGSDIIVNGCVGGGAFNDETDVMWACNSSGSQSGLLTCNLTTRVWDHIALLTPFAAYWDALAWGEGGSEVEPEPGPAEVRFAESPPWRFLVTDRDSVTLTFLDKLATDRRVTRTLNEPLSIECSVPSDNPEVNILISGDPFVQEGNRLLYAFRRENPSTDPEVANWVCRGAGVILNIEDRGDANVPESDILAFDPWGLLYRRPVVDSDGDLPRPNGFSWVSTAGNLIAQALLNYSASTHGETHIDLLSGTIETTETLTIDFQQGMSVGEAWDALVETGTLDIVLDPVYDPVGRPGIVSVLNIYARAGQDRRNAVFAWDKPSRSIVDLGRTRDGRERANKVQFYIGQGGPPVSLVTDTASVSKYGQYWQQQFFPAQEQDLMVELMAEKHRQARRNGLYTYSLSPAAERSPVPFIDYDIGDSIPIYASNRLREPTDVLRRVISIPLAINDDQLEAPVEVLVSEEEEVG